MIHSRLREFVLHKHQRAFFLTDGGWPTRMALCPHLSPSVHGGRGEPTWPSLWWHQAVASGCITRPSVKPLPLHYNGHDEVGSLCECLWRFVRSENHKAPLKAMVWGNLTETTVEWHFSSTRENIWKHTCNVKHWSMENFKKNKYNLNIPDLPGRRPSPLICCWKKEEVWRSLLFIMHGLEGQWLLLP